MQFIISVSHLKISKCTGFTAAGESLNCSTYDVGLAAAAGLEADKLFILHQDEVKQLCLPAWLPLGDAQNMLIKRIEVGR